MSLDFLKCVEYSSLGPLWPSSGKQNINMDVINEVMTALLEYYP